MTRSRTRLFTLARLLGAGSALLVALWLTTATAAPAQTFKSLVSFDGTNGVGPEYVSLVQGRDGNYYGTTVNGGAYYGERCSDAGCGTVFKITPGGTLTTVYSFCSLSGCPDGAEPSAGLVLGTDGNFYGTTYGGGVNSGCAGCGTVFKITPAGKLTTLYSFCALSGCADGELPYAGLVQATNGNFYGTTFSGGTNDGCGNGSGCGTIFKITPAGKLTTLHSFCSQTNCSDGAAPYAGLVQATNGNFYGTTRGYGSGPGTVFEITPAGKLTTLYAFCSQSGCGTYPLAGLVQGTDGNFYGTTESGGAYDRGIVFKVTPTGKLTTLYSFCSETPYCTDGTYPLAGLVQGTDGNFYGTTSAGGANGYGTVFKITPKGKLTTLYSFCSQTGCTDGQMPSGGVFQATDGTFYGTTYFGGSSGVGTVFSLSMGLGPFVSFVRNSGKVGANVEILGQGFTGTTSVSFNGTAAQFKVVSATYLTATVPNGATTGTVTVTTPGGTLNSNVIFRVTPQITSFKPTSGPVGTPVTIYGVSLTQTTKVTFGGVKATQFTVNSDTQVTAYVPTGAKTGHIAITTLGGTAVSSGIFTVTQ